MNFDFRIVALSLGNFAVGTGAFIISGILPMVAGNLNLTIFETGQAATAFSIAFALGGPLLASPTSRIDRRTCWWVGCCCLHSQPFIGALAPNYWRSDRLPRACRPCRQPRDASCCDDRLADCQLRSPRPGGRVGAAWFCGIQRLWRTAWHDTGRCVRLARGFCRGWPARFCCRRRRTGSRCRSIGGAADRLARLG